jgi:hypothetical protein
MSRIRIPILLQLILIAALAFGTLATVASVSSAPTAIAKEAKGKDGDGKGKSGKHKDKGNEGHGKSGKDKKDKKDKQDDNRGHGNKEARVEAVVYTIDVSCEATESGTACTFTPQVPDGAHKVTHFLIPADAVCAPVIGGESHLSEPDPVTGVAGYTSNGGESSLELLLGGEASPGGQATYWVKVTGEVLPASGPALQCAQLQLQADLTPIPQPTTESITFPTSAPDSATPEPTAELTDSTGSIVVEVYDCPLATPTADYDWFGLCDPAGEGNRFRVVPEGDVTSSPSLAVTDAGGQARFSQVQPGTYILTQVERDWCHAKSDGVDEQGNVIVTAGERTTVWVFSCQEPTSSPSPAT